MKSKLLLACLLMLLTAQGLFAQKKGILLIHTSYTGIKEGFDHTNKTRVYIADTLAAESLEAPESQPIELSVMVPRGDLKIRIVNMALYEDQWEEHTKENHYSMDALYEGQLKMKKKLEVGLVFDLEKTITIAEIK